MDELNMEQVKKIVEKIKEKTAMQAYSLVIDTERQPDIFDSKFGGMPYWDLKKEYPADSDGEKLMLLAQINLDRAEVSKPLPTKGMLQFFTALDDVFGADFDKLDCQDTFRVVYHETVDYNISREEIEKLDIPVSTEEEYEEYTPVYKEAAVDVMKKTVYMGPENYLFDSVFAEAAREVCGDGYEADSVYAALDEDEYDYVSEELSNADHWLLGYPYFTQTDPREYDEPYRVYDTLLFQMDSDYQGNEDYVLWGDCGVANFFIRLEDLEKKDFSRVLYTWDCC